MNPEPKTPSMKTSQKPSTGEGSAAAACSPPLGEYGEDYYCKRDDFRRYIAEEVNPAREKAGLQQLDETTAEVCFRILNDFARQWGCRPIAENGQRSHGPAETSTAPEV